MCIRDRVVGVDGHLDLLGLGHDPDPSGAGVDASLALGDGDALDPVDPALSLIHI